MLSLADQRWKEFEGGYRVKYDASVPLLRLEIGEDPGPILEELWNELHHQGDVGVASYAAVPHIARIVRERLIFEYDPFALVVCIELRRGRRGNPVVPDWLSEDYDKALRELAEYGYSNLGKEWTSGILKAILSLIAAIKGNADLAELIFEVDPGDERRLLDAYFGL